MVDSAIKQRLFKSSDKSNKKYGGATTTKLEKNNLFQLINEKKQFLILVFSNLVAQLGITYYTMMNYPGITNKFWLIIIAQFVIIFFLALVTMPSWIKFILFSLFSFLWGVILAGFRQKPGMDKLIQFAVAGSAGVFATMVVIGMLLIMFGIQLGMGFATGLFIALLLLIIVQFVLIFINKYSVATRFMSGFGLLLFSLFIIYDTNNILQRNYSGDFITASLDYYLDIINVFVDLLGIYGGNN